MRHWRLVLVVVSISVAACTSSQPLPTASPEAASRNAATAPVSPSNAVDDLIIVSLTADSVRLRWTEKHSGDYDNNGTVGVSDLTPIGQLFGVEVEQAEDVDRARLVDGNADGFITVSDITPIGVSFQSVISGYSLYTDAGGTQLYGDAPTVLRSKMNASNLRPLVYEFDAGYSGALPDFTVRPLDGDYPANPGPVSNVAGLVDEPGAPAPPTALAAAAGAQVGSQRVRLDWTKSQFIQQYDVAAYEIERKLTAEPPSAFSQITEVSGTVDRYTDHDTGMIEESYDYRLRARDYTGLLSSYGNVAQATPYIGIPILILDLTTDKTTHLSDGSEPAAALSVQTNVPADSYTWDCSLGVAVGSGGGVNWQPPAGSEPQVVSITCTATCGSFTDNASLRLFVTDEPIEVSRGESGRFVDFDNLRTLDGTNRAFSSYIDGDTVIIFNRWEPSCPPCVSEMGAVFQPLCETYGPDGLLYVGNVASGTAESVRLFLESKSWTELRDHHYIDGANDISIWRDRYFPEDPGISFPKSLMFDRDGYIRLARFGEVTGVLVPRWQEVAAQLTGGPPPS